MKTPRQMQIEEEYPDNMSREEFEAKLRQLHARYMAQLLLRLYPDMIQEAAERSKKAA